MYTICLRPIRRHSVDEGPGRCPRAPLGTGRMPRTTKGSSRPPAKKYTHIIINK